MKSRLFAAFMAAFTLTAALTGCGGKTEEEPAVPAENVQSQEEEPQEEVTPTEHIREIEEITDFEYEIVDGKAAITRYTGRAETVTVPAEINGAPVTEISYYAFEAKYTVRSITLPETVTYIGEYAFMDCASLESINIPEAVEGIDRGAFGSCTSLEYISIPEKTAFIHQEAFTACTELTSLIIKNPDLAYEDWGLEEIGGLTVYAPEGSAVMKWAAEKGFATDVL